MSDVWSMYPQPANTRAWDYEFPHVGSCAVENPQVCTCEECGLVMTFYGASNESITRYVTRHHMDAHSAELVVSA